jgi:hypothetical protein
MYVESIDHLFKSQVNNQIDLIDRLVKHATDEGTGKLGNCITNQPGS